MKPKHIYIESQAAADLLSKLAKQDAKKRPSGRANKTATLLEILQAEEQRRIFTWHPPAAEPAREREATK
jgi:hypothetical protein